MRTAARSQAPAGRGRRDRVLVGVHHLVGDARPGEPLDVRCRRPGHLAAALGLVLQVAQRLGERLRVAGAGRARRRRRRGRRRGSRRCPRRPPACRPRTPRSAPSRSSRRRATARTARRRCLELALLARRRRPCRARVRRGRRASAAPSSSGVGPITVSSVGMCSRSASNARSSSGRPLRSTAWPTNTIRSVVAELGRAAAAARVRVDVHAVGDHPVVAAEPAPAGPGGRLGDGDPHVQVVEHPARADHVGEPVREALVRVGVERADERQPGRSRSPPSRSAARPARGCGRRRSRRSAARGAASRRRAA